MNETENQNMTLTHGILWDRLLRLECGSVPSSKSFGIYAARSQAVSALVEELFFWLIKEEKLEAFFEIGALRAQASRKVSRLKENKLPIFAAEANPVTWDSVNASIDFGSMGIHYLHKAIGFGKDKVEIHVPVLKNGFLGVSMSSLNVQRSTSREYVTYEVPCQTLDDFVNENLSSHSGKFGLWIDVEGAGLEVLRSGICTLKNTSIAYIEVEDGTIWENPNYAFEVLALLDKFCLVPVLRDHQHESVWNLLAVSEEVYKRHFTQIVKTLKSVRQTLNPLNIEEENLEGDEL